MVKKFLKQAAGYGLINVFQKIIDYLSTIIFVSLFSASEYGIISLNTTILVSLTAIFSLSLEGAISRYYYKYHGKDNFETFLGSISIFTLVISISIGVLWLVFSKGLFNTFFPELNFKPYVQLAIAIAMLDPINKFYIALLVVKRDTKTYAWFFNAYVLLRIALVLCAAIFYGTIEMYFIAYLIAIAIFTPISMYKISKLSKINFNMTYIKESLEYSLFILPTTILIAVNSLIGRGFILNEMSSHEVGVYSFALNVGILISLLGNVLNMSYTSFLMQTYETDKTNFNAKIKSMGEIHIFIVTLAAVVLCLIYPFMISFVPKDYNDTILMMPLFAFTGAANSYYTFAINFIGLKQNLMKYRLLGWLVGMFANLSLTMLLISKIGIYAPIIASFLGNMLAAYILNVILNKKSNFIIAPKIKWYILLSATSIQLTIYLLSLSNFNTATTLIATTVVLFVFCFASDKYFLNNSIIKPIMNSLKIK